MTNTKEFPNLKLEHLRSHKKFEILVAFGLRTILVLDKELNILCRYLDSNKLEKFLCSDFFECAIENFCSVNSFFLIIGGESGIIKIIDLKECKLVTFLKGHTGAIYDLKIVNNHIVSCGEDSTIRIWDLKTLECVAVCGGVAGHKDHVLSVDATPDLSLVVSSGTDCIINQWKFSKSLASESFIFNHEPFTTFNNVHKCAITKVKYWGNLILSLSNNIISVVHNNLNIDGIKEKFFLDKNDPILVGSIEFFGNCKKFEVCGHMVIGISTNADVYIFDLRNIIKEKTPYLVSTNFNSAEDITILNKSFYITSGCSIHKFDVDLDHFN